MLIENRKEAAMRLRQKGRSIKSIAKELGAAQSSVSVWTKEIILSEKQKKYLLENTHSKSVIEKRRQSRLQSEYLKKRIIYDECESLVGNLNEKEAWLVASSLYWGEGAKKSGIVQFTNGDPRMIAFMLYFFRRVCKVPEEKLRAYIHIHHGLSVEDAEKYWQDITKISRKQFYKTYSKPNKSSKSTKNSLPYGVCDIYVMDAKIYHKLNGWAGGIYKSVLN